MPQFKNTSGVWLTRALFFETALSKDNVVYTLKEEDHNGYPSLYRLFMEADDPEEYTFAINHLGGWSHWKALKDAAFFQPHYTAWKEELEVRQRSRAVANIMDASTKPGRDGIEASKYIAEKKWDKSKAGRPSAAKIKQEAQVLFDRKTNTDEDYKRIVN